MPRPKKQSKVVSIKVSKRRTYRRPRRSYVRSVTNPNIIVKAQPTPFRDTGSEIGGFLVFQS